MKKVYLAPVLKTFGVVSEDVICQSRGGKPGGNGKPGSEFDPDDDVYDGGDF
jgi:hypothetical protein